MLAGRSIPSEAPMRRLFRAPLVVVLAAAVARAQGDEPAPVLTAPALLDAKLMKGPHHTVADAVQTPGFYHVFTITSPYGTFEANGRSQVAVRIKEIEAIAALKDVNEAAVVAKAAGESVVNVGKGVASAVTDPEATAKGIGGGVKRMGVNIGRRTKRAVDGATSDTPKPEGESGAAGAASAAEGAGKSLAGINGAMRKWAKQVGVDPYTTNQVLSDALEHIATLDVAGGIAAKVAVPIPGVLGATSEVGDLVWGADPEQVRKTNEQRAREIGASPEDAKAFFLNGVLTLTMQTRLIAALHAVKVPGAGDYLASAAEAADEREALFFVESAEMLMAEHKAAPVAAVLTDARAILAKRASGEGVLLLPIDWLRQTAMATSQAKELASRAKAELGATSLRLKLTGRISDAAARELAALGWKR
jgi:hypothetical protein